MSTRIIVGDALDQLRLLPDESVHCCVTSPPYYGLRDYGTAQWEGGDAECDHREIVAGIGKANTLGHNGYLPPTDAANVGRVRQYRDLCGKCGARRIDQQIGLEPSPDEYVAALVAVFREVRRVLRRDGTLWLNVGDSYASGPSGFTGRNDTGQTSGMGGPFNGGDRSRRTIDYNRCKPKDLIGIPWMLAFALRADGWYLRQDIVWAKPNPMPESVTDRCTKAHEYLFLLSRSERYYYDAAAIAEPSITLDQRHPYTSNGAWQLDGRPVEQRHGGELRSTVSSTRNKRSVWTVASEPFAEAHFATFPPALIEPCIKAGCPRECCAKCGAPWVRGVDSSGVARERNLRINTTKSLAGINEAHRLDGKNYVPARISTDRWSASCACGAATMPGTVLDPLGGAGTTGLVADRLGRNAVLIELSPLYAAMAERRIWHDGPLFADVVVAGVA